MNKTFTRSLNKYFAAATFRVATLAFLCFCITTLKAAVPAIVTVTGGTTASGFYGSLSDAFTAINATALTGPVTVTVSNAFTATAPAILGSATLNASTSATNTITVNGGGYTITAHTGTGTLDDMIVLRGADYVTLNNIKLRENAANTDGTTRMEWGIAVLKLSATDGTQNLTITNCDIALNKANTSSVGIYANDIDLTGTTLNAESTTGANANLTIDGTKISNVYGGIVVQGATAFFDTGLKIGSTSGNTISDFGGGIAAVVAIAVNAQSSPKIENNTILSAEGTTGTIYGIGVGPAGSNNLDVNANTITLKSSGTNNTLSAIYINAAFNGGTANVNNNVIKDCSYTTASGALFYGIWDAGLTASTVNFNGNTITGSVYGSTTAAGNGNNFGIGKAFGNAAAVNVNNNIIYDNSSTGTTGNIMAGIYILNGTAINAKNNQVYNNRILSTGTGSTGTVYGLYISSSNNRTVNASDNDIYGLAINKTSGSTSTRVIGIHSLSSLTTNDIYNNNRVYDLTNASLGDVIGIRTTGNGLKTVAQNVIYSLKRTNTGGASNYVSGITNTGGSSSAPSIYGNKIYNISTPGVSNYVYGIELLGNFPTINVYNNLVGDLKTPEGTGVGNSPIGIGIHQTGNTDVKLYNNTVYLNATSTGSNFSSYGIFHSGNTLAAYNRLDMRNNIIVNKSTPTGTGIAVAFYRNGGSGANSMNNYASTSNNNLFYTGTPSASKPIYSYVTTAYPTLADFKALIGTERESNSFTEDPPFLSTDGASAKFLHIDSTVLTKINGGGQPVADVTTDFEGTLRHATTPDVGADEFTGVVPAVTVAGGTTAAGSYASLSAAFTAVNVTTLTGPVTVDVTANYTETAPAILGSATLNASTSATNTITVNGGGYTITAYTGTGMLDGIIVLQGADYVTLNNLKLREKTANTDNATRMEWGIAVLKLSATDGSQNVAITNCDIALNKANTASLGIYANDIDLAGTTLGATTVEGANANLSINGTTIANVYGGISAQGSNAYFDTGLKIGSTSGNTISDFGGSSIQTSGISITAQSAPKIENNSIVSANGTTANIRGIFADKGQNSIDINANTVTVKSTVAGNFGSSCGVCITGNFAAATANIKNNTVKDCFFSTGGSSGFAAISAAPGAQVNNIIGNTVSNNIYGDAGSSAKGYFNCIASDGSGVANISHNIIHDNSSVNTSGGYLNGIYSYSRNKQIDSNQVYNLTSTGASGYIYGLNLNGGETRAIGNHIYNFTGTKTGGASQLVGIGSESFDFITTVNDVYKSNKIHDFAGSGAGAVGISTYGNGAKNITANVIYSLTAPGASGISENSQASATPVIDGNKIYNITSTNAGQALALGIDLKSKAPFIIVRNNIIAGIKAPAATDLYGGAVGMWIHSGAAATAKVYNNTIYLNGTSTAANSYSYGIWQFVNGTATVDVLDLRNNIIINKSTPTGTGKAIGLFRTSASTLNNYATTSNNNLFYNGTPSAARPLFFDVATAYQTIAAFKTKVGPNRESNSFSEDPVFLSTDGASDKFLHIDSTVVSQIAGGGQPLADVERDFDGALRHAATPDVGADEFSALSNNNNLAGLTLSAGVLSPVFDAATTAYAVSVSYAVPSISLTPTLEDAHATITVDVNGTYYDATHAQPTEQLPLIVGTNNIRVIAIAQDGSKKTYTLSITRGASLIKAMTLNPSTTITAIPGTLEYNATIDGGSATTVKLAVLLTSSSAQLTINGNAAKSGVRVDGIAVAGAGTDIPIVVTPAGGTAQTYILHIKRKPSTNADLATISIDGLVLTKAGTTSYTATITGPALTEVSQTVTTAHAKATILLEGSAISSGSASAPIPLQRYGTTVITTEITAEDGVTKKTYTVSITRKLSNLADLASLKVSSSTLTKVNAATYTATVEGSTLTQVNLKAETTHAGATMTVDGNPVTTGTTTPFIALDADPRAITPIAIVITAEDGTTIKTITVNVVRKLSNNVSLAALAVSSATVTKTGASVYTATINGSTLMQVNMKATTANAGATMTVNGSPQVSGSTTPFIALNATGTTPITIEVTAEDGVATKTYTVNVVRQFSNVANLQTLRISEANLTSTGALTFTAVLPATSTLTAVKQQTTAKQAGATITVNGTPVVNGGTTDWIALDPSGTTVLVTVITAEDGITKKTYTVTVIKPEPVINRLALSSRPPSGNDQVANQGITQALTGIKPSAALSPNGDGIGDYFEIAGIESYADNTVTIVNQGGAKVYEAKGYDNKSKVFDGRTVNGSLQPAGTYFYVIDYKDGGQTIRKTGYLVIRY